MMNHLRFLGQAFLASCGILLATSQAKEAIPQMLTLNKAKVIALQDSPDLEQILARIKAALARIEQAKSSYRPTVTLNGTAKEIFKTAIPYDKTFYKSSYSEFTTMLNATYTLYDGLARQYKLLLEQQNKDIQAENLKDVQRTLLLSVADAYYNAMLERQNVIINVDDYNYNKKLQDQAEKKLKHGTGTKSDVLNFEIQANNAEASRMVSELNYNVGILALIELMGHDPEETPRDLKLEDVQDYLKAPAVLDYETLCDLALSKRPDIKSADLAIQQKETQADVYRADYRPVVSAFAAYGFDRYHDVSYRKRNTDSYAGLQFSWTLFNGYLTDNQVAETLAERLEQESARKKLIQSIKHDVSQQLQTIHQAKKLADLKYETQNLAMQARDLVQKEYDIGRVTSTRLNEAQNDYTNAQGDYVKAVINYWLYRQNLEATTAGILDVAE